MIDVYYWTTMNAHKVTIALQEMELPYRIIPVNIFEGQQFRPDVLKVARNNKIPAIVDHEPAGGGEPISLFESGAILLYLAEKTGKFIPSDTKGRTEVLQWLFWQMAGLGPMAGQNGYFNLYASEKVPHAMERYRNETNRLYGVLDQRLADREYVAGDYSIADMAIMPWIIPHKMHGQDLEDFPNIKTWFGRTRHRDAVERAFAKAREVNPKAGFGTPAPMSDEVRKVIYGQTAASIANRAVSS